MKSPGVRTVLVSRAFGAVSPRAHRHSKPSLDVVSPDPAAAQCHNTLRITLLWSTLATIPCPGRLNLLSFPNEMWQYPQVAGILRPKTVPLKREWYDRQLLHSSLGYRTPWQKLLEDVILT